MELDAEYWLSLVHKDLDDLEVTDCLERHGVSVRKVKWIHGLGRLRLPDAGVFLYLRKTSGRPPVIRVLGAEFVLSGMRGGKAYAGSLPHGIAPTDTLLRIGQKLEPAPLSPAATPEAFEACFPEHRIVVKLDSAESLRSCSWITTRMPEH
jgi:hypothetical protein